ncbi:MAG TPA: hypothetical protein VKK19_05895 [Candidatus Dormibacteraeota bacterium]|nr:hypothetical protein [Candidatus Dormibacteraeota bacterium]
MTDEEESMSKSKKEKPVDEAQEAPTAPAERGSSNGLTMSEVLDAEKPIRERIANLEKQLADARAETAKAQEQTAELRQRHEREADLRELAEAQRFADALDLGAGDLISQRRPCAAGSAWAASRSTG